MAKSTPALRLGSGNQAERPLVDVFGHSYRLKAITRSVQKDLQRVDAAMNRFQAKADEEEQDADEVVAILGDAMGAMLAPENDAPAVADVIVEKWENDELSLSAIKTFSDELQEQAVKADRPT